MERAVLSASPFVRAPDGDPPPDPDEPPWRASATCPVEPRSHPFRVLLAEDDGEMRNIVREALRGDGYDVVEAEHGGRMLVEVAARLKANVDSDSLDLIVSDIRMPVCTGLQIVAALREAHWRTPVILMTAFGDEATRRHAESLAVVLFEKPFDIDDLRTAAANLLPRDRPPGT
jgi:CheY-like chemotaxis protein